MPYWRSKSVFASSGPTVSDLDARRAADEAAREFEAASLQPEPVFDALTLPAIQQAALLMMHESPVKRALIGRLLEDAQDKPRLPEFRALSELGLAEYNAGKRLNDLTAKGRAAVAELEPKLVMAFDLHLLTERGRSGWQERYACPCGFSTYVRASTTAPGNAAKAHSRFVATQTGVARLGRALGLRAEAV